MHENSSKQSRSKHLRRHLKTKETRTYSFPAASIVELQSTEIAVY